MLSRVFDPISLDAAEHFSVSLSLLFFFLSHTVHDRITDRKIIIIIPAAL